MKDETKKRIESISTDEMLFEINLGPRSHFQRESFAYLKTCYTKRLSEENKQLASEQSIATNKANEKPPYPHNNVSISFEKDKKSISLFRIAEGVIIGILVLFVVWIIYHYCGLQLKP